MRSRSRHAGGAESWLETARRIARDVTWKADFGLLVVLGVGFLLWPWLGWVAAAAYALVVLLIAGTLWAVRSRQR